jgi:hypothetical protein
MTTPTVLDTRPADEAIVSISQRFAARFQQEMEHVAQVALDAAPDLSPEQGWRYDVFAGVYVQLAFPTVETSTDQPVDQPADEAKE